MQGCQTENPIYIFRFSVDSINRLYEKQCSLQDTLYQNAAKTAHPLPKTLKIDKLSILCNHLVSILALQA